MMEASMTDRPYLFAGDRQLAVDALALLLEKRDPPAVLCVSDGPAASHRDDLTRMFQAAGGRRVISSAHLRDGALRDELRAEELDFALSVHFPHIIDRALLSVPRRGWLNLHPALLPWNRGWHTPTWAILEGTPAGVTLHRMAEAVDAGEILAQREVVVAPEDTAHTLYGRLLGEELRLLDDVWGIVRSDNWPRMPNRADEGTTHKRADLFSDRVQRIDLDRSYSARTLIDHLRGLTTNRLAEAAYFEVGSRRYRVRIDIRPEEPL
jgi:methionyl-tRNA formyltransferase